MSDDRLAVESQDLGGPVPVFGGFGATGHKTSGFQSWKIPEGLFLKVQAWRT